MNRRRRPSMSPCPDAALLALLAEHVTLDEETLIRVLRGDDPQPNEAPEARQLPPVPGVDVG